MLIFIKFIKCYNYYSQQSADKSGWKEVREIERILNVRIACRGKKKKIVKKGFLFQFYNISVCVYTLLLSYLVI